MLFRGRTRLKPTIRALLSDRRGSITTITALLLPAILLLVCGAIDIVALSSDHAKMQDVSDATALMSAKQLGASAQAGIAARADDYARASLADIDNLVSYTVTTSFAADGKTVAVTIDGTRQSFFGSLLPPGGWKLHAQATASALGEVPLCVLATGAQNSDGVALNSSSRMSASGCLVQSNNDVKATGSSLLTGALIQAVGTAQGAISPAAQTGAPAIADPFTSLHLAIPSPTCSATNVTYLSSGTNLLQPGEHCGNLTVKDGAALMLAPGEHYFTSGQLQIQGASSLTGTDVVLVFDKSSHFSFDDQSNISLAGRQSGPLAGFVIATTRTNTQTFSISSTSAHTLLGTVYIPSAKLQVSGTGNQVADQSAWTVIVANDIQLVGSANLVINANYAGSAVPVPAGVGPGGGRVALTR